MIQHYFATAWIGTDSDNTIFTQSDDNKSTAIIGIKTTPISVTAGPDSSIKIPNTLSIIGIDDIETSQYVTPMLTTVHIPIREMGSVTAKVIIDRIQGGHTAPMKIFLPSKLVIRESCAQYHKKH